ncbi:Protein of unknown function (DUF3133 [Striga hermonthica]|uniref:Zinc-ribbon domain-containing protein n=1 Tax=Striga hermonthica TaxID=68872 RepID=A0A9N7NMM4_STRHE|nr:Protein of unknown function (DUF3133 [Striga hermonthica]
MADEAKVRLVRCPKCENLLPELPDFSLYQCGGCGAVLKAKHKGVLEDELPDISDDGTGQEIREDSNVVEVSEVKMANAEDFEASMLGEARKERVTANGSSESTEAQSDSGLIRRGKERIRNLESLDKEYTFNRNLPINRGPNVFGSEYVHFPDEYVRGHRPPMEPLRPSPGLNKWARERSDSAQMRFVDSRYFDEGQSSYETDSYYRSGERTDRYRGLVPNVPARMEDLENGRAELIWKLDELKDQISRSCGISDKSKEMNGNYDQRRAVPSTSRPAYNFTGNPNKQPHNIPNDVGPSYFADSVRYGSCPYKPEILHGPPYGPHSQYVPRHPYHHSPSYYYGDVKNNNLDHFMLNRHDNFLHQPACSCMHCYDKSLKLRAMKPRKSLFVNSNDVDFESDGLNSNYHRPRKFLAGHKSPFAGGAPFIGCSNCFEVLKIPRRRVMLGESKQKLICGACSSIIVFELEEKGFIVSASVHVDREPTETDECSSGTFDKNARYSNSGFNSANLNTYSNEYENFHDRFSPIEKLVDQLSTDSSLSEHCRNPEDELQDRMGGKSSPDQNIGVNRFDQRNKSQRPEQEKVTLERNASQQKSNEFSNGRVSDHVSVKIVKEAEPKANKGDDSFFTGLIKKSFKDFKKPNQCMEAGAPQVSVNGRFIPDRVVKLAEKLAGPIQPGEYWYDKRAGFWGVMGHPCIGIIMPNIEEFDYPMPDNCAGGNTGVFVNGRELHTKDLDLLASRGLPLTRNRSYLVEINGTVIDEQTGEELDGLGKLAPTVERAQHGFGMKVPRFIAQSKN